MFFFNAVKRLYCKEVILQHSKSVFFYCICALNYLDGAFKKKYFETEHNNKQCW